MRDALLLTHGDYFFIVAYINYELLSSLAHLQLNGMVLAKF